VIKASK